VAISVRSVSSATGTGTTITVAKPQGVQAGDTLWAIHCTDEALAQMTASGWSQAGSHDGNLAVRVWRRTATIGEASEYSFGQAGLSDGQIHVVAVQGADPAVAAVIASVDNTTPTTPTPGVSPAGVPSLEIRFAAIDLAATTITWQTPSGYTNRGSTESVFQLVATTLATKSVNTSAASDTAVFTASPQAVRASVGLTISIAAAATQEPEIPTFPPFTPARGDARYQYRFRRLRDGQFLGFLELANVSFDKRIGQPGSFSATVPIPSGEVGDLVAEVFPRDSTVLSAGAGVVVVDILRDGDIWGEYWITEANPSQSGRATPSLQIQGTTLDGYLNSVEFQTEMFFEQADQIDILRGLVASMQGQQYANIGLVIPSGMSGVLRDRTYADDGGTYGQRVQQLAEVDNGFEYCVDVFASGGTIVRQMKWGYPRLGEPTAQHILGYGPNGGEIVAWGEQVSASRGATRYRARGGTPTSGTDASTTAQPLISSVHEATDHLDAGWPRIDRTLSYSDVTVQDTLEDYAAYWVSIAPGAVRVETYTVALGSSPSLHPNKLGDWCRIYLDNEWHRPHWRERRIIGLGITPVSRQDGKEQVQLVLAGQDEGGPSVGGEGGS
jgi:hypothetical protein